MSTDPPASSLVGASVQGPAQANTTGAVTSPVPGSSGSGLQVAGASGNDAAAAMDDFLTAIAPAMKALSQHMQRPPAGGRATSPSSSHMAAAPMVSALARRHPEIGNAGDPDAVDAGVATLAASQRLAAVLKSLLATVEDTGRLGFSSGWLEARLLMKRAESQAKTDKTLEEEVAPVHALFARGPKTVSSARVAADAQQRASAAQARATAASQRAAAHARAAALTAEAQAARQNSHGVSSTPTANPQGPSASANVNPHGPSQAGSP